MPEKGGPLYSCPAIFSANCFSIRANLPSYVSSESAPDGSSIYHSNPPFTYTNKIYNYAIEANEPTIIVSYLSYIATIESSQQTTNSKAKLSPFIAAIITAYGSPLQPPDNKELWTVCKASKLIRDAFSSPL